MEINLYSKILKIFYKRGTLLISSPLIFYGTKRRFEFFIWINKYSKYLNIEISIGTYSLFFSNNKIQ